MMTRIRSLRHRQQPPFYKHNNLYTKKGNRSQHLLHVFRNVIVCGIFLLIGLAGMGWTFRGLFIMNHHMESSQQQQKKKSVPTTITMRETTTRIHDRIIMSPSELQQPKEKIIIVPEEEPSEENDEEEKEEEAEEDDDEEGDDDEEDEEEKETEQVGEEEAKDDDDNNVEETEKSPSLERPNNKPSGTSTVYLSNEIKLSSFFHPISSKQKLPPSSTKDYNELQLGLSSQQQRKGSTIINEKLDTTRKIDSDDETKLRRHKRDLWSDMDDPDMDEYYYKFDERTYPKECIIPSWMDEQYPNCNTFHEITLDTIQHPYDISYLGQGHYRDSFLLQGRVTSHDEVNGKQPKEEEKFVLKHMRLRRGFDYKRVAQMHTEALLMEKFSSSPRFTNIYGYCATSLLVEIANEISEQIIPFHPQIQSEPGRISQSKLDELEKSQKDKIYPFNNFTTEQKLEIAIQMAEALAEMHGCPFGAITNDDFHPDQFLITDAGNVILNDMNNAVFLEWNPTKQKYCEYYSSFGGDFRDPREYVGSYVDESVDIPPMGYSIFILLTGLWPYYEYPRDEREKLQAVAIAGKLPYINPAYKTRSLIEKRMVEIMYRCMAKKAADRPDIFEVLQFLYETKSLHKKEIQRINVNSKLRH